VVAVERPSARLYGTLAANFEHVLRDAAGTMRLTRQNQGRTKRDFFNLQQVGSSKNCVHYHCVTLQIKWREFLDAMWRRGQSEDWDSGRSAGRSPAESSLSPPLLGAAKLIFLLTIRRPPSPEVTRTATDLARELTDKCY
jgi:hypothetical protein